MPHTVYDYLQRALTRRVDPTMRAPRGPLVTSEDDAALSALFAIAVENGRVASANYRCTTCATLVALCEHTAELIRGLPLDAARRLTSDDLLSLHPEIPSARRDRAALAIRAAHGALELHPS